MHDAPAIAGPVAIVGLGMMGGSLAGAIRKSGFEGDMFGVDRDPVAGARALERGLIDRFDAGGDALIPEARTVVYAAPLRAVLHLLGEHAGRFHPEALVTDVVSIKAPILGRAQELGIADQLVGAHPLCGSEGSGVDEARPDLYEDARLFLCAADDVGDDLRARAQGFWRDVGARPEWIEAAEHDRVMAWVSHLPQLVSNALAGALHAAGFRPEDLGPGARDMTRLAGSSPEMWKDLLTSSAPSTGAGLTSVTRGLQVVGDLLARRDIDRIVEFMERTRAWRNGESDG